MESVDKGCDVTDVFLAGDMKELLAKNSDVRTTEEFKSLILNSDDDELLIVTENFEHGIEITKVVVLTPEYIQKQLK